MRTPPFISEMTDAVAFDPLGCRGPLRDGRVRPVAAGKWVSGRSDTGIGLDHHGASLMACSAFHNCAGFREAIGRIGRAGFPG
jgi:hypothetical protein